MCGNTGQNVPQYGLLVVIACCCSGDISHYKSSIVYSGTCLGSYHDKAVTQRIAAIYVTKSCNVIATCALA